MGRLRSVNTALDTPHGPQSPSARDGSIRFDYIVCSMEPGMHTSC